MFLQDLLTRRRHSGRTALVEGERSVTYREWYKYSVSFGELIARDTERRNRTALLIIPNSIYYAYAYFAALYAGCVVVPQAPDSKDQEFRSILSYVSADVIITTKERLTSIKRLLECYPFRVTLMAIDSLESYDIASGKAYAGVLGELEQQHNGNDVAVMLHTSGTTASPKRVMLTHHNLISNIRSHVASLGLKRNDRTLIVLPMYFGYCNTSQFLTHLYLGAVSVVYQSVLHPRLIMDCVQKYEITNMTAVPSLLVELSNGPAFQAQSKSLRYLCFGGGKTPVSVVSQLCRLYPWIGFVHTYGLTECSPRVTVLMPHDFPAKSGSVGHVISGVTVRIFDEDGRQLGPNQHGEICVSGPNVMRGYFRQPQVTKDTIREGWLHTGDFGYLDEDGYLYLSGRIKNVIICNGMNLYPEEIEEVILSCPDVLDVLVYGEENLRYGEIPVAKIVACERVTADCLKTHCRKFLSEYKIPKRFDVVSGIEKTYNGKNKRQIPLH